MVLDFLIRIERGYPGERATTTAANTHFSFKKKRKETKKKKKKKKKKKRVWISLYMYIFQSISRLRAGVSKSMENLEKKSLTRPQHKKTKATNKPNSYSRKDNKKRKEMFSFASMIAAPMASSTGVSIGMRTKRNSCSSSGGNRAAVYASAARLSSKRNCFRTALSARDRGNGRSEGRRKERIKTRPRANIEPASDQDDDDDGENFAGAGFMEGWKGELFLKNIDLSKAAGNYYVGIRERLLQLDPGLNQTLISSGTSISQLFDQDKWEKHRRVNRFFYDLQNIPSSTVFLRLVRVLLTLTFLAYLVLITPETLLNLTHKMVPYVSDIVPSSLLLWMKQSTIETFTFHISPLFHTMLGTVLGLVLVFRTNSSYSRFVEGRVAWGALVRRCRDFARFSAYIENEQLRKTMLGVVSCYPYLLKSRLRSGRTREDKSDPSAFRDTPDEAVNRILNRVGASEEIPILLNDSRNRPFFCTMRLTHFMKIAVKEGINDNAQLMLEQTISEINQAGGVCERLIATPIPLSFSRHSSRSIMIWLLTLPFALSSITTGWTLLPLMFCVSYLILGVDEIGIQIEEPFATLPLTPLCKIIERDLQNVMDCTDSA